MLEIPRVPAATHPLIEIEGLGRRFGTDPPVDALIDVDLLVQPGDWLAIVGPSGSGKSTLLNVLGCLDRQTSGTYLFDGVDVAALSDKQRAGLRSRGIGFVFQSFHLMAHRTVIENVMLAEIYRKDAGGDRRERAAMALEQVGLGHRMEYLPTKLSGGERQRVAIARAVMGAPGMLLCDEPTGNLDSTTTESILELFAGLNEHGQTVVMITHEHEVAERAHRQVRMTDGRLLEIHATV
ncbi:ABC transporter ATP-binding protein [Ilumatobacter sp.]|uniref:ABC transporter ATP-binding protein n=1 Tax=Ilumatobacter sp. TaxID=1967498 RepID=UPI003750EB52